MLQDPQVLGNDHNKPHSLMSDPISTMYFHNMFCDLLNKILFKPNIEIHMCIDIFFLMFELLVGNDDEFKANKLRISAVTI